ncbi:hypothetical protein TNCV_4572491 [Trichonephila clavipes]|nr:hypothetical protein TNCV_4572491 [Trichonephila clavipes]
MQTRWRTIFIFQRSPFMPSPQEQVLVVAGFTEFKSATYAQYIPGGIISLEFKNKGNSSLGDDQCHGQEGAEVRRHGHLDV